MPLVPYSIRLISIPLRYNLESPQHLLALFYVLISIPLRYNLETDMEVGDGYALPNFNSTKVQFGDSGIVCRRAHSVFQFH